MQVQHVYLEDYRKHPVGCSRGKGGMTTGLCSYNGRQIANR